jgi:glycosyltransferase involved in cell wall biosynthesis
LKIAIVAGDASPALATDDAPGGRHSRVAGLARALAERGHQVTVHGRRSRPGLPDRAELGPGLVAVHVTAGPAEPLGAAARLETLPARAAWLLECWTADRPDVVHACGWDAGLAALAAAHELPGLPVVHERLGEDPVRAGEEPPPPDVLERLHRLRSALVRGALAAVAQSAAERDRLVRLGLDRRRIQIIPPGVDTEHFVPPPTPVRREASGRVLCLDGRDGQCGLAPIVTAMTGLPGARLTVAGGSRPKRAPRRVEYLGAVPYRAVPELLRAADVLATSPRPDGGGSAALEAMACGVPVVGADVGVLQDLVVHQVTGLLVPAGRPDLMADAVRQLLHGEARRYALGIAGADRARARHAWPRIAAELEDFHRHWTTQAAGAPAHRS